MSDLTLTGLGYVSEGDLNKWNLVIHYMAPIMGFYKDPEITEIMVNRFDQIFVEGRKGMVKTNARFNSEAELERLIRQISIALRQDEERATVIDARFPDQSRACCTTREVTPMGSTMTIRCTPKVTLSFSDLVEYGALTESMCDFLKARVEAKDNIIVSGSTGSGKTTLLRAIAEFIPDGERVIVCEDTQELFLKRDVNFPEVTAPL